MVVKKKGGRIGCAPPLQSMSIAGVELPFLDLSAYRGEEKEPPELEAMQRGETLVMLKVVWDDTPAISAANTTPA